MLREILTEDDLQQLLADSRERPIMLLKHSTACGISARAKAEFDAFCADAVIECALLLVIQQRPLSLQCAQLTGVTHQSPQALLLRDGQVAWHASHGGITRAALTAATHQQGNR